MSSASKPAPNQTAPVQAQLYRGIVKNVVSGDCVVIRSLGPKDGKVLEKQLIISNITAPRLGRRIGNPASPDSVTEPDQPYGFDAREFLRKKIVGKEVCFVKDANSGTMERGSLYLGKDPATGENLADALVSAGLAEVRRIKSSEEENRLVALEDQAKAQGKGKWSKDPESDHVRNLKYTVENPKNFVDSFRQKPIDAIIEYVRDASTLRVLLLPSYQNITLQLSGIKAPGFKREKDNDKEVPEPFAEEAKYFVESRLLHRDVRVILEGVANQSNGILLGSILHPNGNIAEFLLKDGLAKCVDWSIGLVTGGAEKYRTAEKQAKQAKLRLWKNYTQAATNGDEASKNFTGKVVEILNSSDGMTLKLNDGSYKKIYLSSVRAPRAADFKDLLPRADKKNNPLYDVPYLFEAREFLRKKVIGKKVNCTTDYIQPKSDDYPEKVCCTVMLNDTNVAEALISQGLAKAIRYRQDDEQRSSKYDELLTAESRAQKKGAGIHSTKEPTHMKIADVSGDVNKAKQFLPTLQRAGRIDGVVEFVSSGSRFRIYVPKETCLITFVLSGVDCPKAARPAMGNNPATPAEEFGDDALLYSKSHTLQHEVKIEIEAVDKVGNFIGQLFTDEGVNLSVGLVENGFASVYRTSTNASYIGVLNEAEKKAKEKKLNRWKNYVEPEKVAIEETEKNEPTERVESFKTIVITEINSDLHFYGQLVENGPKLETLTTQLRAELASRPPVAGAYTPKVGDTCVAKFSADDEWYRAKVLEVKKEDVTVLFIDYGNKENTKTVKLASIPAGFETLAPQAHEYALAFVQLSSDEDDNEAALDYFKQQVYSAGEGAEFKINSEYKNGTVEHVILQDAKKVDIGKKLVAEGYLSVERGRRERRLQKLVSEYQKALASAKQSHKNMWRYGDKEEDDAHEFGATTKREK